MCKLKNLSFWNVGFDRWVINNVQIAPSTSQKYLRRYFRNSAFIFVTKQQLFFIHDLSPHCLESHGILLHTSLSPWYLGYCLQLWWLTFLDHFFNKITIILTISVFHVSFLTFKNFNKTKKKHKKKEEKCNCYGLILGMNEVLLECFPIYLVSQHFHSVLVLVLTIPVCWIENHSKVLMSPRYLFPWQTESPTYLQTHLYLLWISVSAKHQWSLFLRTKIISILARSNINIKKELILFIPISPILTEAIPYIEEIIDKEI